MTGGSAPAQRHAFHLTGAGTCGPVEQLQPRGPADMEGGRRAGGRLSGRMSGSGCLPVSQAKAEHELETKKKNNVLILFKNVLKHCDSC